RVIKPWCAADGNPIAVQGQDWYYHKHHNKLLMHAAMNLFFDDKDAARFERNCIDIMVNRQKSTGRGCLLEKNGERLDVTPGLQSAFENEYGSIRTVILSYLLHLLRGPGVNPENQEALMEKLEGNHIYPYGKVYIYRTKNAFSSFAARCSIMGLTLPGKGIWDITPDFQSYTGIIRESIPGNPYFNNKKINWNDIGIEPVRERTSLYDKGFSIMTEVPRAGGKIIQSSSFTALPDGKSVYIEKIKAIHNVLLASYETGRIGIGNENFEFIPKMAKGFKDVYFNGIPERFHGGYEGEDVVRSFSGIDRVNIDDTMGYLLFGSSGVEYRNIHKYPKWKGLEDILILNKRDSHSFKENEESAIFATVSIPNATSVETDECMTKTAVTSEGNAHMVIRTTGYRVTVNFSGSDEVISENPGFNGRTLQIYRGITSVNGQTAICSYRTPGFGSFMETSVAFIDFNHQKEWNLEIICMADGVFWIENKSAEKAGYALHIENRTVEITQPGGGLKKFGFE
ncbi:MAG: hypothetical protein JXB33_00720, partial [Clostridia bacterium]|nr:hypothetical protein [Clostridia bacterium]